MIAIMIFGIVATGLTIKSNKSQVIILQSAENPTSASQLSQSAEIIRQRLVTFGTKDSKVAVIRDKNQIAITLLDPQDIELIKLLVTQKGRLEFFETYIRKEVVGTFVSDSVLTTYMETPVTSPSSSNLGCSTALKALKLNSLLNPGKNPSVKFMWTNFFGHSETCLYALKITLPNSGIITGSDIENFEVKYEKNPKVSFLEFHFKKSAVNRWAEITRDNINRSIAMVLDNNIVSAPMVQSQINGGNCQITGDFTPLEVLYLAAVGNSSELPLSLVLVK